VKGTSTERREPSTARGDQVGQCDQMENLGVAHGLSGPDPFWDLLGQQGLSCTG